MPKTKIDFSNIRVLEQGLSPENDSFGQLLDLSDEEISKIKRRLKKELEAWRGDTADLHEKLQHWDDLAEGIIDESDEPFEGAFQTHIDIIGIYLKIYTAVIKRSILGSDMIWYTEADPGYDNLDALLPKIDTMMNYKARAEWNVGEMLGEVVHPACRDGLAYLKFIPVHQEEEIEEKIILGSTEDFQEEFPSPEDGDLEPQEWQMLGELVASQASPEAPIEVPITVPHTIYDGPKAYLVERINFVTFPATARSLERESCRGFGDRFYIRREEVRQKMEAGEWHEDACKEFLHKTAKKGSEQVPDYMLNREEMVGIARSENADDYEFYELVCYMRLDKKTEKKYHFVYCMEPNLLMMSKMYEYRVHSNYARFRIDRRAGQLDGRSVVGKLEFPSEEIDQLHNQRFQSWQITNIPSFKASTDMQKEWDDMAKDVRWSPGVVFFMKDPSKFEQFNVHPTDQGQTMQEEQNLFRIIALIMGIDAFLASGRPSPEDPTAPGNKTIALIDQGNIGMEEPISEIRYGVEEAGEICLSMLYQFGDPKISFKTKEGQKTVTDTIVKRVLRSGIKVKMQGVNVIMNSEAEFKKWMERAILLAKTEPLIAGDPERRTELVRTALRAGRFYNADKILPTIEEIRQKQIDTMKIAIQQMMMEQQQQQEAAAVAQAQAEEQQKKQVMSALSDKVRMEKITQQLIEQTLAKGGNNVSQ